MNKKAKCSDKIEPSFTLFGALKMKNITENKNGERHPNKFMVTVSPVAIPCVVINKKINSKLH